jgi:hypothetical protein
MKNRKLRIAWSVAWEVACLLMIALWVRSYGVVDDFHVYLSGSARVFQTRLIEGRISLILRGRRPVARSWYLRETIPMFDETTLMGYLDASGRRPINYWFYFRRYPNNGADFGVPFWAPTLFCAAIAMLPWFHWSNRFSLRTLLIAMTLVAVGLGAIVYAVR